MMRRLLGQLSSGLILGLSAVIYALSYAALMFAGPLAPFLPYAITATLITAAVGGLYGLFAEEPTLVSGPDSNTSSVLAATLATAAGTTAALTAVERLNLSMVILLVASVFCAAVYLLIERFGLARLVRFIPFQVMAGFLASTGWLMTSGALNIISGTPLTLEGLSAFLARPDRPELLVACAAVVLLGWLQKRFNPAVAIPAFMIGLSLVLNFAVRTACSSAEYCAPDTWFFPPFSRLAWLPPWELHIDAAIAWELATLLPSFLAVAFVGTLTVLLSLGSLELTYGRDFGLEEALELHGRSTLATAAIGGYIGIISIARSNMCRATGGGRWSGLVIAAVCLGALLGLGWMLAWIPKVALGALLLYLGVMLLKQWLWDVRTTLARAAWLEVVAILMGVVAFGYVVGFLAGLLAACIFFVVNYSRMPFVRMDSTLASVRSSVIRNLADQAYLAEAGTRCRIGRFEGFVFFGVANSIYEWYRAAEAQAYPLWLLDFSRARGMDNSAAAVIEKIVRIETARGHRVILVLNEEMRSALHPPASSALEIVAGFDAALERAEDLLLAQRPLDAAGGACAGGSLDMFGSAADRQAFQGYLREKQLAPGEVLFAEGQPSDEMYFVESGRLDVVKTGVTGERIRLSKVVAGSMIGEMALYSGQARTATVIASDAARLLMLTRDERDRMRRERPDLAAKLDHHVVLGLANTVARANTLLGLQAA